MARSRKKKTVSQTIVGVATTGMPQPVKRVLGGRLAAGMIVLIIVPLLYFSGVVTVKWENSRPRIAVNRERVAQVWQMATDQIDNLRGQPRADRSPGFLQGLGGGTKERAERSPGFLQGLGGGANERADADNGEFRPLAGLKDRLHETR